MDRQRTRNNDVFSSHDEVNYDKYTVNIYSYNTITRLPELDAGERCRLSEMEAQTA